MTKIERAKKAYRRVKRAYPDAVLVRSAHGTYWQCSAKTWSGGPVIGEGVSKNDAWIDAASSLPSLKAIARVRATTERGKADA